MKKLWIRIKQGCREDPVSFIGGIVITGGILVTLVLWVIHIVTLFVKAID